MSILGIVFILYLIVLLSVGVITVRHTKNLKDFALGGHRLGPWVIAFSERASGESAWLLLGLPGAALVAGLFELWTVVGCVSGIIVSWLIIAKPLREATTRYNALTLPELLSKRFDDDSGTIRLLSSLIITFFFTFYVAAQFSGAGKVLNVTFGLTHIQGMIIGAIIIVSYTIMGGFLAVAWTDVIQGVIMVVTLVVLPIMGWIELSNIPDNGPVLDGTTLYNGKQGLQALIGAIGGLSWGFGYMGQPHLVIRYMAIKDPSHIKTSRKIAYAWAIPAFFGSMFIGLIGLRLIEAGKLLFEGNVINTVSQLSDPEKLMPIMATNLMHPWIAGICISAAIAAMMSTADSQLLVSTTVLTEDIFGRYFTRFKEKLSNLSLGRILTVLIGIIAFIMGWQTTDLVFELVSYAWSGLGASFGPALILALWWSKTTKKGVIAGMITGALVTVVWANIDMLRSMVTERLVSFVAAFLVIVVVSVFESKKQIEV